MMSKGYVSTRTLPRGLGVNMEMPINAKGTLEQYLDDTAVKALTDRLSRAEGSLRGIVKMIAERRCVDEILTQIAAVKGALNQVTSQLLERQLRACFSQCAATGDREERLQRLATALSMVIRQS
jgi:DNA-binding FrmR family transcriptional regulator